MYLVLMLVAVAIFCVIAGILSGGVFTLILIPIAVIAAAAAAGFFGAGRMTRQPGTGSGAVIRRRTPARRGEAPATPDDLVAARQRNQ